MVKKILLTLLSIIVILLLILITNTLTLSSSQPVYDAVVVPDIPANALERFSESITYRTISYVEAEKKDTAEFIKFHEFLARSYPLVDSVMEKKLFGYSLLYKWQGTDASLPAVVFMGHMDVVPVDSSTMDKWEAEPFSGDLIGNKIVGRGTLDDKVNVVALMETTEMLINEGFSPKRTIYFSFGHDEEVGGDEGAKVIAEYLRDQGTKIEFVIDEGGFIVEGMVPGVTKPMAMINTGEKGYVSFKLTINTPGGHSSQPPRNNTIGSLATAITKLESNQFDYKMIPVIKKQIEKIGSSFPFAQKMAFANTWLFGGPVLQGLNAHTTIAPTMISAGVKDNVIPTEATAVVNFRIMPGETSKDVKEFIINTIDDDRIRLETISNVNEPSPVSSDESAGYKIIEQTIIELFPDMIVTPGLLGGGTDSKHFIGIADNVYRFYPTRINPQNFTGFHGNNEFCTVENFEEIIQFSYQLIKNINK